MQINPNGFYPPDAPEMRILGAVQTLARWRCECKGPNFHRAGSRILYRGADVLAYLEANRIETGSPEAA